MAGNEDIIQAIIDAAEKGSGKNRGIDWAKTFEQNQAFRFENIFVGLWGEKPNPSYILSKVKAGFTLAEFEFNERAKPAFKASPRFAEEALTLGASIANRTGAMG